jgi:hypothetical protein
MDGSSASIIWTMSLALDVSSEVSGTSLLALEAHNPGHKQPILVDRVIDLPDGWLRDYLWFNSSQLINGYSPLGVTKNAVWDWMFLFGHLIWATGFMWDLGLYLEARLSCRGNELAISPRSVRVLGIRFRIA